MKYKAIAAIIFGSLLADVAILALAFAVPMGMDGHRRGESQLEGLAIMFGMGAFIALLGAALLFIYAFNKRKTRHTIPPTKKSELKPGNRFFRALTFIFGVILVAGGVWGIAHGVWRDMISRGSDPNITFFLFILVWLSILVIIGGFLLVCKAFRMRRQS